VNRPEVRNAAPVAVPAPPAPARPLAVHIHRVVLDEAALGGLRLDARGRSLLQSALQGELAARLARGGGLEHLATGGALAQLRAGELRLAAGKDAASLGRALARKLARVLQAELEG